MQQPIPSTRESLSSLTCNLTTYLASLPGTTNISLNAPPACSQAMVTKWETTNSLTMPADLKDFYCVANGLTVRWSTTPSSTGILSAPHLDPAKVLLKSTTPKPATPDLDSTASPVGLGHINGVGELNRLTLPPCCDPFIDYYNRLLHPSSKHSSSSSTNIGSKLTGISEYIPPRSTSPNNIYTDVNGWTGPNPATACFVLDDQGTYGCVVIAFYPPVPLPNGTYETCEEPSIWFVDRSYRFHYLCDDLTSYIRLLVIHLGIKGWWGIYGDGMDPVSEAVMRRFAPERLVVGLAAANV
jgi:hypothetical protein